MGWCNVDLYISLSDSTLKQDQLQKVVDYDFIRDTIRKRIMQGYIQLQETFCDDIAKLLVAHPKVREVVVSIQKPDVYPDCDSVSNLIFYKKLKFSNIIFNIKKNAKRFI